MFFLSKYAAFLNWSVSNCMLVEAMELITQNQMQKLTQQCQFDFSRTAFMDMIHFSTNFYCTATILTKPTL